MGLRDIGKDVGFFGAVAAILIMMALYRRWSHHRGRTIIYEDNPDPLVQQLNLT